DTNTWTPRLNSGTGPGGVPVYDNASVRRLESRGPGATPARPDFSNVRTGSTPSAATSPVLRRLEPTAPASMASSAAVPLEVDYTRPAPPDPAPAVRQSVRRTLDGQRDLTRTTRADAAEVLNPMSNGAEMIRRLENSQSSY